MENRVCAVCDSLEFEKLFHQSFSGFSENNLLKSYDVVACEKCGFCFADKIPAQKEFDAYYRDLSKYENKGQELRESPYDLNRFSIMVSYIKNFLKNTDDHIVEVGCATGFLLSRIKKTGFNNITGIDPSPACAETAKKYYDINVLTNTLSNIQVKKGSVDFLLLVGVLEHVKDLDSSLEELWNILSPTGKFFIAVPDASQYFNGKDAPYQEFSVEHINFFGPASLENLMLRNGFSQIDTKQTLIEVNRNTFTPVLMSVFQKNETRSKKPFKKDEESKKNLKTYISLCGKEEEKGNIVIQTLLNKGNEIILWGTGAQTLRLLANSKLSQARIKAFVDSNPKYQGKTLNGVPIISPESLKEHSEAILISTRAYQNEIEDQIRNTLMLKNEIIKLY